MKPGSGNRMSFEFQDVCMLQESADGKRLIAPYGLADGIKEALSARSEPLAFQDLTPESQNTVRIPPDWTVLSKYSLRNRQDECLRAIDARKHGIINAPVGFGKTFLMGLLVQLYPRSRFHFVTKSVAIAKRIYKDLLAITPDVGMVGGGENTPDRRVTVFTADSLGKSDGMADFLIWDECHQAAAPTYAEKIVKLYTYSRNYGFSATPTGRSDGSDAVLQALFGSEIFHMGYDEAKDNGLVVPIRVRWLVNTQASIRALAYTQRIALERHVIWTNAFRNQLIAEDVHSHYGPEDQILILVGRIEHAIHLSRYLPEFTLIYGGMTKEDCTWYQRNGLLPEDYVPLRDVDKDRIRADFLSGALKKVIATDVWNTGVDFPNLGVVYNVSARGSKILTTQGGGRVSRLFNGKDHGEVVDVVDRFEYGGGECFLSAASKRRKQYDSLGWEQEGWPDGRR